MLEEVWRSQWCEASYAEIFCAVSVADMWIRRKELTSVSKGSSGCETGEDYFACRHYGIVTVLRYEQSGQTFMERWTLYVGHGLTVLC